MTVMQSVLQRACICDASIMHGTDHHTSSTVNNSQTSRGNIQAGLETKHFLKNSSKHRQVDTQIHADTSRTFTDRRNKSKWKDEKAVKNEEERKAEGSKKGAGDTKKSQITYKE